MGKSHNIEAYHGVVSFVLNIFEPVYNVVSVLPLVHVRFSAHAVSDLFLTICLLTLPIQVCRA